MNVWFVQSAPPVFLSIRFQSALGDARNARLQFSRLLYNSWLCNNLWQASLCHHWHCLWTLIEESTLICEAKMISCSYRQVA